MRIAEKPEDGTSCGFNHLFEPSFYPRIWIRVLRDVADHGDRVRAGGINLWRLLELDAADRDQRDVAGALLPFGDFRNSLRCEAHRLQRGRKDRTKRDIVRFGCERD